MVDLLKSYKGGSYQGFKELKNYCDDDSAKEWVSNLSRIRNAIMHEFQEDFECINNLKINYKIIKNGVISMQRTLEEEMTKEPKKEFKFNVQAQEFKPLTISKQTLFQSASKTTEKDAEKIQQKTNELKTKPIKK